MESRRCRRIEHPAVVERGPHHAALREPRGPARPGGVSAVLRAGADGSRRYGQRMGDEDDWTETARLLSELAMRTEQQPQDDDPLLDLAYVPRSPLGAEHRWEVNLNLGPEAETCYWTGPTPQEVLRTALEDLTEYLAAPSAFLASLSARRAEEG